MLYKKKCRQCGHSKSPSSFYKSGSGNRRGSCKTCVEDQNRWINFGILPWDYWNIWHCQDGRCFICEKRPKNKEALAVDHNHKTGAVRGLLCKPCNLAIGLMQDSTDRLAAARVYLTEANACTEQSSLMGTRPSTQRLHAVSTQFHSPSTVSRSSMRMASASG